MATFSCRREDGSLVVRWQHTNPAPALSGSRTFTAAEQAAGEHRILIDALRRNNYGETA